MPQVVNSENLVQFTTTGSVPEFKAPEAVKPDAKPGDAPADKAADPKPNGEAKPEDAAKAAPDGEPARDASGKFVKADDEKPADGTKSGDDDEDAQLTEKVRKIIGKKHRAQKEAEEFARERDAAAEREARRADAAERELQRIRGGKSDGPKAGEGDAVDPDEPKQADFKTVGEYTRALVKYEAQKAGKAGRQQQTEQRQQEQADAAIEAFAGRQEEFRKSNPNYDDIVEAADINAPPLVMQYLIESEVGPALNLFFAQNPDEISRLRKLSPSRQMAELGKLEIKFEKKPDPPATNGKQDPGAPRDVSKAPAPIAVLEGKSTPVQKDPSQMTVSELRAHRHAEALAKAGR